MIRSLIQRFRVALFLPRARHSLMKMTVADAGVVVAVARLVRAQIARLAIHS